MKHFLSVPKIENFSSEVIKKLQSFGWKGFAFSYKTTSDFKLDPSLRNCLKDCEIIITHDLDEVDPDWFEIVDGEIVPSPGYSVSDEDIESYIQRKCESAEIFYSCVETFYKILQRPLFVKAYLPIIPDAYSESWFSPFEGIPVDFIFPYRFMEDKYTNVYVHTKNSTADIDSALNKRCWNFGIERKDLFHRDFESNIYVNATMGIRNMIPYTKTSHLELVRLIKRDMDRLALRSVYESIADDVKNISGLPFNPYSPDALAIYYYNAFQYARLSDDIEEVQSISANNSIAKLDAATQALVRSEPTELGRFCNTCSIRKYCPSYIEDSACTLFSFDNPKDLIDPNFLMNRLMGLQMKRVEESIVRERLSGSVGSQETDKQIELLSKLAKANKPSGGNSITIKGTGEEGVGLISGLLSKLHIPSGNAGQGTLSRASNKLRKEDAVNDSEVESDIIEAEIEEITPTEDEN